VDSDSARERRVVVGYVDIVEGKTGYIEDAVLGGTE